MLLFIALLTSCGSSTSHDQPLAAQASADVTRAHWETARKPIRITIEGCKQQSPIDELGVYSALNDATDEEREAFSGVRFSRMSGTYQTNNHNALTTDTAAHVYACYPYRKGLKAQDAISMRAPFGENLYGKEIRREFGNAIDVKMELHSAMAVLRVVCESDDVRDHLDALQVYGEEIFTSALFQPYSGKWYNLQRHSAISATNADCLLNNGRKHDFYLIPTEKAGVVTLCANINGAMHAVKTTLPPMRAGSMTQLNIRKDAKGLSFVSSWVESDRPLMKYEHCSVDTVKVGHFLQKEGYVSAERDSNSVAMVIETDGTHGKAIALTDCEDRYVFSRKGYTSKIYFATIDGKRREGVLNPSRNDDIAADNIIIFKPKMPYTDKVALGYMSGQALTARLQPAEPTLTGILNHAHTGLALPAPQMLDEAAKHPGSYIPSLGEMAMLYYRMHPFDDAASLPMDFTSLSGEYLTSSEATEKTFYMIDFDHGVITGGLSKQYARLKLRLFYLF